MSSMKQMKSTFSENIFDWAKKIVHPRRFKQTQPITDEPVKETPTETTDGAVERSPSFRSIARLSLDQEYLEDISPATLKSVLTSTLKAKSAEPTTQLVISGNRNLILRKSVSARKIRTLGKACPFIRELAIANLNLCPSKRKKRVNLSDFPSTLEILSVRDSVVEIDRFLSTGLCEGLHIRVLDLGRSLTFRGKAKAWPTLPNLEELYLEGIEGLDNDELISNIFEKCPKITLLDLEGTDVKDEIFILLSKLAPNLRQLFVGFTRIQDRAFYEMEKKNVALRSLELLCLADTQVSNYGVDRLRRVAPKLRDVTVNRSTVTECDDINDVFLPLRLHRTCNVHIGAVFRNQGCEHFKERHGSLNEREQAIVQPSTHPTPRRIETFEKLSEIANGKKLSDSPEPIVVVVTTMATSKPIEVEN